MNNCTHLNWTIQHQMFNEHIVSTNIVLHWNTCHTLLIGVIILYNLYVKNSYLCANHPGRGAICIYVVWFVLELALAIHQGSADRPPALKFRESWRRGWLHSLTCSEFLSCNCAVAWMAPLLRVPRNASKSRKRASSFPNPFGSILGLDARQDKL